MKRTCVQCGEEFELTKSELDFYRRKKLAFPKRCKACREQNKKMRAEGGRQAADTGRVSENPEQKAKEAAYVQKQEQTRRVSAKREEIPSGNPSGAGRGDASGKKGRSLLAAVGIVAGVVIILVIAAVLLYL